LHQLLEGPAVSDIGEDIEDAKLLGTVDEREIRCQSIDGVAAEGDQLVANLSPSVRVRGVEVVDEGCDVRGGGIVHVSADP
jgi:hypothetical protein